MRNRGKSKVKIRTTSQGIEISISRRANESLENYFLGILIMGVCFIGWSIGGVFMVSETVASLKDGNPDLNNWYHAVAALFSVSIGFLIWFCIEVITLCILLGILFKLFEFEKEKMSISTTKLAIGTGAITYDIDKISNLRHVAGGNLMGTFLFDYGTKTVGFGKYIRNPEAKILFKQLSDILTFHCQSTEIILFGNFTFSQKPSSPLLQNPDVSELTFPFVRLKQILVHVETYDFHLIEKFLTYAVNCIGQGYLKREVEVHIYGDVKNLHPNIWHNFKNFCKTVHVYDSDTPFHLESA